MIEFFKAIQAFFEAEPLNPFYIALAGEFYFGEAEGDADTYAVYFGLSGRPEDTWSASLDDVSFQVNCHAPDALASADLLEKCKALFNGARLLIPGFQDVVLQTEMFTLPRRDGDKWVSSIEFQGLLIKIED